MSESRARPLVYGRSVGRCEPQIPGVGCTGWGAEWHHRLRRSQRGLWLPSNGLHVCRPCHAAVTRPTDRKTEFEAAGWIVPPWADPASVPVLIHTHTLGHALVLLDDDGMISLAPCAA
ncbi:hypothetical protein SUDANB95_05478 [Actinosynnema sp. ALI-1.44]